MGLLLVWYVDICDRNLDMIMAACFNGAERNKGQWMDLLHAADERFVVRNIVRPAGSMMSVIEVVWSVGK